MSDSRDHDDTDGRDSAESLVPHAGQRSGRRRRGLRVPVDDVPRQSFVDLQPPSRPSLVPPAEPRAASGEHSAPARHAAAGEPLASGERATSEDRTASEDRMPSEELSLDAEEVLEAPRSYPPPPPPPTRSLPPPPRPDVAAINRDATPPKAHGPTRAEPASLEALARAASTELPDATTDDAQLGEGRATLTELDWTGDHASNVEPIAAETTKVGKKRSSAPPPDETSDAHMAILPDSPAEAPTRASLPPPPAAPRLAARPPSAPPPARSTSSRPAPATDSRETPRGLFDGLAPSTELALPPDEGAAPRATPLHTLETATIETATIETAAHTPDASAIAVAAGAGAASAGEASDPGAIAASGTARAVDLDPTPETTDLADTSEPLALDDDLEPDEIEPEVAELDAESSAALHAEVDANLDSSELEAMPAPPAPAPVVAPPSEVPHVAVLAAPVVIVQRAVTVLGEGPAPSSSNVSTATAATTHTVPGGISAPSAPLEALERESDPALSLELDDPPSLSDDDDLLEVPPSQPPKAAPPPPPAAPPAPPTAASPPAPPKPPGATTTSATAPPQSAIEEQGPIPSRPPPKKKPQWWEELFSDDYLRTVPVPSTKAVNKQVDFIEQRLGLAQGATILDVGCGLGLHAIELTRRGYLVVGLDLSLPMLSRAADEAQDQGFKINFLHADMREMNFEGAFDAVLLWGTTLGYFDDDTNKQVLERIHRALKPGGLILLEVVNRDFAVRSQPNLVWFQGDGCVVMEETSFNFIASRLQVKRNVILDDGRQRETTYSVRLYSLHELGQVLHQRGFRVSEITGREATPGVFFGADSPKLIVLAERRVQAPPAPPKKPDGDAPRASESRTDLPKLERPEAKGEAKIDAKADPDPTH